MVRGRLEQLGLPVGDERPEAVTELEPLPRLLGHPSPEQLFDRDPRYGQVVCACEQVTAAEIAAVHGMAVPPTSLEGVRKRTRATGGRCQGALCLAGVSFQHSIHAGRHALFLAQIVKLAVPPFMRGAAGRARQPRFGEPIDRANAAVRIVAASADALGEFAVVASLRLATLQATLISRHGRGQSEGGDHNPVHPHPIRLNNHAVSAQRQA
jgi:hypothetical protein